MKKTKKNKKFMKKELVMDIIIISIIAIVLLGAIYWVYKSFEKKPFDINTASMYNYNGFDFYRDGSYWITQIEVKGQPYEVRLSFSPVEVENVSVIYNTNHLFTSYTAKVKPVVISFDPRSENQAYVAIGASNTAFALAKVYGLNVSTAFLVNDSNFPNVPVVTCSKKFDGLVVVMNNTGPAFLEYKDNCLFFYGQGEEIDRAVSRAALEWYGILRIDQNTTQIIKPNITVYR